MKNLRTLVAVGVAGILLAGCITLKDGKIVVTDPRAQAVVNGAQNICSFKPLIDTVLALLKKSPGATADQLAALVCSAVQNTTAAQGRRGPLRAPVVMNVKIKGDFTDGRSLR